MRTVSAIFAEHLETEQSRYVALDYGNNDKPTEIHFSDDAAGIIAAILTLAEVLATK